MKRLFLYILTLVLFVTTASGQSFTQLWKQSDDAAKKDLPQTQISVLKQIEKKAEREKAYGHLLKANMLIARLQCAIDPDSLEVEVIRLQKKAENVKDTPLKAVYYAVLGKIYEENTTLSTDWRKIYKDYFSKAIENPAALAAVKADIYEPFVIKGSSSNVYGDDLLSLIGHETRQFKPMHDYYMTTDNRRAQLFSALYMIKEGAPSGRKPYSESPYIRSLDSLANQYGDLQECGEVAITRYEFMKGHSDASTQQKIEYIDEALSRWNSWQRMNELRNYRRALTSLQFRATLEHQVYFPNRQQKLFLSSLRGINDISINIFKVNANGDIKLNPNDKEDYKQLKSLLAQKPELTITRKYSGKKDYELYNDTLTLDGLPVGVYMMEVKTEPQTEVSRALFFISRVRGLTQSLPGNKTQYVAVDAITGKPIAGAKLQLRKNNGYRKPHKTIATLTTDKNGECIYHYKSDSQPDYLYASTKDDSSCPEQDTYGRFSYYENDRTRENAAIYTDRAIYRPGQTVQVAVVCYDTKKGFEHEVVANKAVKVNLRDANYKTIAERDLTTNDMGVVNTDFTLPSSGLTGQYSIVIEGRGSKSFRVEEYKRPTFYVEFEKVDKDYKDGDTLTVRATARTYSGVPIQGAKVKYTIDRNMAFWWMSYSRYWQQGFAGEGNLYGSILNGEATTGDDGTFEVKVPFVMPESRSPLFCNFVVSADVTDMSGETRNGKLTLPLSNRKTIVTTDIPEKILAESDAQYKLHVLNAAGNEVDAMVSYSIDNGKKLSVKAGATIVLPKLKSGKHELTAYYDKDTLRHEFTIFSLDDKRPATDTDEWFYVSDTQFPDDGKPVTLQVGSSRDVHIIYTFAAGNEIIEKGTVDCANELFNRKLTYKPEYGNGLTFCYVWMRDGKTYTNSIQIKRPLPDKTLKMRWETFRDRLTPGQQEEWTLKIEAPSTNLSPLTSRSARSDALLAKNLSPLRVNLLATLYDKSLDQITGKHVWRLEPYTWLSMPSLNWNFSEWNSISCNGSKHEGYLDVKSLDFSHFDTECLPYSFISYPMVYKAASTRKSFAIGATADESSMVLNEVALQKRKSFDSSAANVESEEADLKSDAEESGVSEEPNADVPVRTNLQETAFFYPQLTADTTGTVSIKFTLPESLTTWRFMGIAHTKDMMHGYIEGEAIAQKDVMIQPNMPRFLRVGDKATISARVSNMTDNELSGTVRLQLIDPESDQVVYDERSYQTLAANKSNAVAFQLDGSAFVNYSLLICKMSISGEKFSDGEQNYLPILSNRERVTVTLPFTQNEPGTKTIDLAKLYPQTANNTRLTVEYTNSPAWLMIQSLPTLGTPNEKNAISQAASLYANCLGKHIISQNPQAKQTFDMWKMEEKSAVADAKGTYLSLNSSLQNNQELKDLLLNETPWVLDAERESEQKQRLSDFFDDNKMEQRINAALSQLRKLQNADGSWSWWEGMPSSFYMTVEVSEMLMRLKKLTGNQKQFRQMLNSAIEYMNKEIIEMVAEMKKQEKKGVKQHFPTFKALQYLYITRLNNNHSDAKTKDAQDYLKNLLKKDIKNQTIYEKAMSAIILNSPQYIKSLKEYTVYKEEMGRFYNTQRASYSWYDYRIPTQVAAIEAIQELTPNDTKTIDEMRRWLLQEKRTQVWDTPINSVNAIYAFLNGNSKELKPQPSTALRIDGKPLETSKATAGIGYVKTSQTYNNEKKFTAEKTSEGTSWGAVYAQFMQPTADISDQKSGISVKREILTSDLSPLTSNLSPLKVGNRIKVRLTITADRDYDFVQIVDKRAACMEPVKQLSGYHDGAYCSPRDNATHYFFDMMRKGKHVIETEYYIDRPGIYETGTCTVGCAYAPEYRGMTGSVKLNVEK